MNMMNLNDYDILLLSAIENLEDVPYKEGGEGRAYFLSDTLVLKKYIPKIKDEMFEETFEMYCKELQKFGEQGFNVPKIYSWLKMPDINDKNPGTYCYYILEELVKGRDLFYGYLEDFYPLCKDLCSEAGFVEILENPEDNQAVFCEILKRYVDDFILVNEYLCEVSDNDLEKFLSDLYVMTCKGKFSIPDFFPSNVLISPSKISIIDPHVENRVRFGYDSLEYSNNEFIRNLFYLFYYNELIANPEKVLGRVENKKFYDVFYQKNERFLRAFKAAVSRVVKLMNKSCGRPLMTDAFGFKQAYQMLSKILSQEESVEIMSQINTSFLK